MKYLMMVCTGTDFVDPGFLDPEPWLKEMRDRGIWVTGDRLRPSTDATTVRVRNSETLVSDGPYAETKEQMGGFDILECADLDEAIEVASKHPLAPYGMLELRPFWEM